LAKRPLLGITCCTRLPEDPVQAVAERYLRAAPFMGADAVLVPSTRDVVDIRSIVGRLDGILLTGSPSNIAPRRYRATEKGTGPFYPARDETVTRIIEAAVDQDRPVFGICRGFQEVAVAYGATLRRDLGEPEREQIHHTPPPGVPLEEMFGSNIGSSSLPAASWSASWAFHRSPSSPRISKASTNRVQSSWSRPRARTASSKAFAP